MVIQTKLSSHTLNHFIVECATAHSEHIGEADPSVRFLCIPAVHLLVNVSLKVLLTNKVVDAIHHSTELSPESFNGIRITIPDNIFLLMVMYHTMGISILTQLGI